MQLDISPFEHAIAQIEESLSFARSPEAMANERLFFQFRAAAIQAFEYTYELSRKTMKRFIETAGPSKSETDVDDFNDLLRIAREYGLIRNIENWFEFRKERNITSHTYDASKAAEVYAVIPRFLDEVIYLRDQIRKRQEGGL